METSGLAVYANEIIYRKGQKPWLKGLNVGIYCFHKVCIRDRLTTFMAFGDLECKHLNFIRVIKVVWFLRAKTLKVLIFVFI